MCNKCEKRHSEIFQNHQLYKLDKDFNKIFTGFCKQLNHKSELNYFVKIIIYYVVLNVFQK